MVVAPALAWCEDPTLATAGLSLTDDVFLRAYTRTGQRLGIP